MFPVGAVSYLVKKFVIFYHYFRKKNSLLINQYIIISFSLLKVIKFCVNYADVDTRVFRVVRNLSCTKLYVLCVVDILPGCHIVHSNLWRLFYNGR